MLIHENKIDNMIDILRKSINFAMCFSWY